MTGRGSPPAGQAVVLSNQQQGTGSNVDSTMYFAVAKINPGTQIHGIQEIFCGIPDASECPCGK